jgi:hypothetical protein
MQKRMILPGGQIFLHEEHVHHDTSVLHYQVKIGFLEKSEPRSMITMDCFDKKHRSQKKA